jgi:hypothetical protein
MQWELLANQLWEEVNYEEERGNWVKWRREREATEGCGRFVYPREQAFSK